MCGLWGAISSVLTGLENDNVTRLAIMNSTRGMDSTGAAFLWKHKHKVKYKIVKQPGDIFEYLSTPEVRESYRIGNLSCIMGHDRYATLGKVNQVNAHPFHEGEYIGCHNGTIEKYRPKKEDEDHMTDSKLLFQNMRDLGDEHALKDADDGAYAVTYINIEKGTFNIARNFKRTLYGLWSKNHTTLYWASELWMVQTLEKLNPSEFLIPFSFDTDKIHTFDLANGRPRGVKELRAPFMGIQRGPEPLSDARRDAIERVLSAASRAEKEEKAPTSDALQLPSLPSSKSGIPETGVTLTIRRTDKYMDVTDKHLCLRPKGANVTRHVIKYVVLGFTDHYNKEGEFFKRQIDDWGKARPHLTGDRLYKAFKNAEIPQSVISTVLNNTECTLCGCAANMKDDIYWHDNDKWICVDCKSGEGQYIFNHQRLYKGEVI
jgi:predicted glutamine amidotransferase